MPKIIELKITDNDKIYQNLVKVLIPYREEAVGSVLFIVEGTKENPLIGIRYPGKKLKRRYPDDAPANRVKWANLFDFEVVPFEDCKELDTRDFTFEKILVDFQENKRDNEEFWRLIEEIYYTHILSKEPPKLPGINPELFLLTLKWIWLQEDFNYRFNWEEVNSPIKYVLETRTGTRTAKGAGRAKFLAALILLKHHFTFEQVSKIISLY